MTLETRTAGRERDRNAQAVWIAAPRICEVREAPLSLPVDAPMLVRMLYCGASRGTENIVLNGRVLPTEFEWMRGACMAGLIQCPVKYGYSAVGTVEAGDEALSGRSVCCHHLHQDFSTVDETALTPQPQGLAPAQAVLTANMETALNIVWDANILPGSKVIVFGAGVGGVLVIYLASRISGTEVLLVDRIGARQGLAEKFGIELATGEAMAGGFDQLINASSSTDALRRRSNWPGRRGPHRQGNLAWQSARQPATWWHLSCSSSHHRRFAGGIPVAIAACARNLCAWARQGEGLAALISSGTRFSDLELGY